jgi:hypothetical protein
VFFLIPFKEILSTNLSFHKTFQYLELFLISHQRCIAEQTDLRGNATSSPNVVGSKLGKTQTNHIYYNFQHN